MADFKEACERLGIALFVFLPRSTELNGHVERMQRTFRDEFYTWPLPSQIPELHGELNAYLDHYNRERSHRALNGLAPLEFLALLQEESVPRESQMWWPIAGLARPRVFAFIIELHTLRRCV